MYFIFKKLLQSAQCINVGKLTYALNMYMDKRNQNIKNRIEKRRGANLVPLQLPGSSLGQNILKRNKNLLTSRLISNRFNALEYFASVCDPRHTRGSP